MARAVCGMNLVERKKMEDKANVRLAVGVGKVVSKASYLAVRATMGANQGKPG